MYSAIAKNKRNTALIIIGFITFFSAISIYVGYLLNNYWVSVGIFVFVFAYTIVQVFQAGRWSMALAGGVEIYKREEHPKLWGVVEKLAQAEGMPMPRVFMIEDDAPNAFATGRNPENAAVAVNTGLLNLMSREEVAGVIAHELAHIKNHDTLTMTITATIAGAISMIANFGMFFGHDEEGRPNPIAAILAMIVAPFAAMIVQMAISRTREFGADKAGAEICGNPAALASALAKIAGPARQLPSTANSNPAAAQLYIVPTGISDLFSTHPATEKRIAALQAMSRPEPRSALDPLRQS